jgi:hypothetical protein
MTYGYLLIVIMHNKEIVGSRVRKQVSEKTAHPPLINEHVKI